MADEMEIEIEAWKPVPGHRGQFVASSLGRIARIVGHSGASGYQQISMKRDMKPFKAHSQGNKWPEQSRGYAHHLVALAFHGQPSDGRLYVNHKDFDRSNNRPENLEWCSQKENVLHARAHGRIGEHGRKVSSMEVQQIIDLYSQGKNYDQISEIVGRHSYTVGYQIRKQRKLGVIPSNV